MYFSPLTSPLLSSRCTQQDFDRSRIDSHLSSNLIYRRFFGLSWFASLRRAPPAVSFETLEPPKTDRMCSPSSIQVIFVIFVRLTLRGCFFCIFVRTSLSHPQNITSAMFHTKVQTYENTPSSDLDSLCLCVLRQPPALLGQRRMMNI